MKKNRSVEWLLGCAALLARRLFLAVPVLVFAVSGFAKMYEQPRSFALNDKSQDQVEVKALPKFDSAPLVAEDRERAKDRLHPRPRRFAIAADVAYTLNNSGTWQNLPDGRLWRLRIQSPSATSLNLGITRFDMPEGGKLWIYDPGHSHAEGPYTSRNRSRVGSLWTPVIEGAEIVVEVFVPTGASQPVIQIGKVNQGYSQTGPLGGVEGSCEIDVICPQGNPWRSQIQAVGLYTIDGTGACTGNLLNDIPHDFTNYFLTANHCMEGADASTVVVYWNFESPTCGTHTTGPLTDTQTGSILVANYAPSDFALLLLSTTPDPSFNVWYAGWDATGVAPPSTVVIHHPEDDVKAISLSNTPPQSADYLGPLDPTGNHWQVVFNVAGTEDGSSGACLFRTDTQRCIGQNHGGDAACMAGNPTPTDYYGKFSVSWTGGGTSATRLKDWLDPGNTGALTDDGDPHLTTANGVHYNFQGAGEYVSLRDADGLEIQTRQSPIATNFTPGPDAYDGVASCVSLNTAVAARVAGHRVTYEPNLSGVPDPSGLQLRVDGVLTTLGPAGLSLGSGGRIAQTSMPGGLEIDFPDNNVLYATPGWWASQSKWYLDVDVVHAPSTDSTPGNGNVLQAFVAPPSSGGLLAAITAPNWLPSLPDGTQMGVTPTSVSQRYTDLYHKFGDAWRITDATSLFDYAPGTSTSTFTVPTWPSQNGSCTLPGVTPVQHPASRGFAEQACHAVTGKNAHADCVFDVIATGNPGFATTYVSSGQVTGGGTSGTPPITPSTDKLAVFLDLGAGFPQGTFSNAFDTGFSLNAGLEYLVDSYASIEGIFGYQHFPGSMSVNVDIYQFSANAKLYLAAPQHQLRPFINGGIGDYTFSPGGSKFGANVGAGILYQLTSRLGLQGSYNFHNVNTPVSATRFSTVQGGIRILF
jgi:lysyl endopeptidase